jgi:hypothetical protein
MSQGHVKPGSPFRPDAEDLKTIAEDVSEIGDIQKGSSITTRIFTVLTA